MLDDFNATIECYAICTYLKSFGYKAQVNRNTLTTYVQDPVENTFVVMPIPNWEIAREFIALRAHRKT